MKSKLYLESTIPSYLVGWVSRDLVTAAQQQDHRPIPGPVQLRAQRGPVPGRLAEPLCHRKPHDAQPRLRHAARQRPLPRLFRGHHILVDAAVVPQRWLIPLPAWMTLNSLLFWLFKKQEKMKGEG